MALTDSWKIRPTALLERKLDGKYTTSGSYWKRGQVKTVNNEVKQRFKKDLYRERDVCEKFSWFAVPTNRRKRRAATTNKQTKSKKEETSSITLPKHLALPVLTAEQGSFFGRLLMSAGHTLGFIKFCPEIKDSSRHNSNTLVFSLFSSFFSEKMISDSLNREENAGSIWCLLSFSSNLFYLLSISCTVVFFPHVLFVQKS